jgi:hypothetical protein
MSIKALPRDLRSSMTCIAGFGDPYEKKDPRDEKDLRRRSPFISKVIGIFRDITA